MRASSMIQWLEHCLLVCPVAIFIFPVGNDAAGVGNRINFYFDTTFSGTNCLTSPIETIDGLSWYAIDTVRDRAHDPLSQYWITGFDRNIYAVFSLIMIIISHGADSP